MTNKRYFLLAGIVAFIGLVAVSCSVSDKYPPAPTPVIGASAIPSITPLPTLIPFSLPTSPTAIPYPTASTVKANAVAFIEGNSLWVANVDGSGERKLTDIEENVEGTSQYILNWSPDGKWISYISNNEVWIISPDGSDKKKILGSFEKNKRLVSYHWSPDSSMIVYIEVTLRDSKFDSESIRVLNLKTGETYEVSTHKPQPYGTITRWSPDGQYLVFNRGTSFVIFNVVDRKLKQEILTDIHFCSSKDNTRPVWSPNSEWFFHIHSAAAHYASFYMCISGLDGSTHRVELDGTILSDVVWDEAGNFLYFIVGRVITMADTNLNREPQLKRYDVKTQKLEQVLSLGESDGWSISMSSDGNTLMLQSQSSRTKLDLIFVDIQSLTITKSGVDFGPVPVDDYPQIETCGWSPDNKSIIFFFKKLYLVNEIWGVFNYGNFYKLDTETGELKVFSGIHPVEHAVISPVIATTP